MGRMVILVRGEGKRKKRTRKIAAFWPALSQRPKKDMFSAAMTEVLSQDMAVSGIENFIVVVLYLFRELID